MYGNHNDGENEDNTTTHASSSRLGHHSKAYAVTGGPSKVFLRRGKLQQNRQYPLKRHGLRIRERRLSYYTDYIPVAINSVTDNPLCAGAAQNPRIMCAIVSSTVCAVLEEGDDPNEERAIIVNGLRQAVDSGDFLRRIPAEKLTMTGES